MTIEHKIVVGLSDIKAVIFECANANCHARVIVSPDNIHIPKQCPACNEGWISIEKSFQSDTSQEKNFVDALAKLRVLEAKPLPFKILLEFEDEPRALVTTKA
jgi:hypothetical protein